MSVGELAAEEPNAITDGPFGSKLKTEHYQLSGPRVVRLQNIGDADFKDAYAHISESHFQSLQKHRVYEGDIVIAALGEVLPRSCIIPESLGLAIVKADCIRFKPKREYSAKYLNYALNWEGTRKRTREIVHGVGRPRLNLTEIKSILLPVAPPEEQERIVGEIETQLSRLEAGVSALKRAQANLKRYRAATLKAACEGHLVPTEAELALADGRDYESGVELLRRVLTSRRSSHQGRGAYREPEGLSTSNTALAPEGWTMASVDELGYVGTGATPKRGIAAYFDGGTIPWVTSAALNRLYVDGAVEFVTEEALAKTNLTLYPPGTLLVAMYGEGRTRGKCSELRISATTNQAIAAIQTRDELRPYIKLCLLNQYEVMRQLASGGVQPNLNLSLVRDVPLPLPPLAEQVRIVAEVDRRLSVVDELEATITANLHRATRLRQAVLSRAFGSQSPTTECIGAPS